jgi:hypothetical protein
LKKKSAFPTVKNSNMVDLMEDTVVKCILNDVNDVLRDFKHEVTKTNQRYLENLREQPSE